MDVHQEGSNLEEQEELPAGHLKANLTLEDILPFVKCFYKNAGIIGKHKDSKLDKALHLWGEDEFKFLFWKCRRFKYGGFILEDDLTTGKWTYFLLDKDLVKHIRDKFRI